MEITEETLMNEFYRNLSRRDSTLWSSLASVDLTSDGDFRHWRPSEVRPSEEDLLKESWPLPVEDTVKEFEQYLEDIGVRI